MSHISGWELIGDTIIWGLKNIDPGELVVAPIMAVPAAQNESEIEIHVGGETKTIVVDSTTSLSIFEEQAKASFNIRESGTHTIKLTLKSLNSSGQIGYVWGLKLTGSAITNAEVWKRRWRPLAVHCKWKSSKNPTEVVLSVHENTIQTTDIHMYQPITTPFGYIGSTWDPEAQTFGGYNFSLWSYGANDPVPPLVEFSHLIAVGKGLTFGEYGHEGTGVKPRGPHPYEGIQTNQQTIAVRKVPGEYYDTYYSYYLHPETNRWKLYGCGKKFNKSEAIKYLWTGAFVEEPGKPEKVRNGHIMREVHYKGWQMDENGQWFTIDIMSQKGDGSSLSYKNWGVKDGKFFMQMGGLMENVVTAADVILPDAPSADDRPEYLKGEFLDDLYKMPAEIKELKPESVGSNNAVVRFNLIDGGTNPKATIFWGMENALTFDYKWSDNMEIDVVEGINSVELPDLTSKQKYYYRVQIINKEGITWLMDTESFNTK